MSKPIVVSKLREPYVVGGNVRRHHKLVTGRVSYTTGGDDIDYTDIGDTWVVPPIHPVISLTKDRIAYFIPVNNAGVGEADVVRKVRMFITSIAGVEVANASNQSAIKFVVAFDMQG